MAKFCLNFRHNNCCQDDCDFSNEEKGEDDTINYTTVNVFTKDHKSLRNRIFKQVKMNGKTCQMQDDAEADSTIICLEHVGIYWQTKIKEDKKDSKKFWWITDEMLGRDKDMFGVGKSIFHIRCDCYWNTEAKWTLGKCHYIIEKWINQYQ